MGHVDHLAHQLVQVPRVDRGLVALRAGPSKGFASRPAQPRERQTFGGGLKKVKGWVGKKPKCTPPPLYSILDAISENRSLRRLALTGHAIDIDLARKLAPLLQDSRFHELKIGGIAAINNPAEDTYSLLWKALQAILSFLPPQAQISLAATVKDVEPLKPRRR